jgi:hypothetical protein
MQRPAPWREPRTLTGLWVIAGLSLVLTGQWANRAAASTASPAAASLTVPTTATTTTVPPPPPTTTTTTVPASPPTTTTTAPPPPPTTTATAPPPPPPPALPPRGEATAWGCGPALAYLQVYADPKFQLVCPGDAQGHQAVTCISAGPCAPGQWMIGIADPCPAAYMNEAHNSWVLDHDQTGVAIPDGSTAIDPYGYCH